MFISFYSRIYEVVQKLEIMADLSPKDRLKVILFKEVQLVCNDSAKVFDMTFSNPAVEIIAELCWKKLRDFGEDLELFARHSKRSTISNEDVKLVARRNPSLKAVLCDMEQYLLSTKKKNQKSEPETINLDEDSNTF